MRLIAAERDLYSSPRTRLLLFLVRLMAGEKYVSCVPSFVVGSNSRQLGKDLRSPAEKHDVIAGDILKRYILERFVFYKYYDGYSTDGEVGFHLGVGPPGSINHRRAYSSVLEE